MEHRADNAYADCAEDSFFPKRIPAQGHGNRGNDAPAEAQGDGKEGEPEIKANDPGADEEKEERVNRPEFDDPYKSHAIRDPRFEPGKKGNAREKKLRRAH